MSKANLGVELNKNWRIRCSSWDSPVLTEAQIDYAAKDSLVAIGIFQKFATLFSERTSKAYADEVLDPTFWNIASEQLDRGFAQRGPSGIPGSHAKNPNA